MILASYAYRIVSNFVFLGLVYAAMHALSGLRSFYFFQRVERLEATRRLAAAAGEGHQRGGPRASRSSPMSPRSACRRDQILYRHLLPALVILLGSAKIVTS